MKYQIETILDHYIACALWSSVDDEGNPLDDNYCDSDIAPETVQSMREDVTDFVTSNIELLDKSGLSWEQIGHDFWLTRNHHGAGFWDRGLGAIGDKLTKIAQAYGSIDLYIGGDGRVYQ